MYLSAVGVSCFWDTLAKQVTSRLYTQCRLVGADHDGIETSWIPKKLAVAGRVIRIKSKLWRVDEAYGSRHEDEILLMREDAERIRHKKGYLGKRGRTPPRDEEPRILGWGSVDIKGMFQ